MQAYFSSSTTAFEAADRLHSASIHLLRSLRRRDRETGIGPAQLSALSVLVFGGAKSLAELAEAEQVKPPTMSRIVAGLLRAKLIHIKTDKSDRRAVIISPMERGVKLMQDARTRRVNSLARAVSELPEAQIDMLRRAAEMIESLSRTM
jgi:DNA-binding MarR family transcriptional regulator